VLVADGIVSLAAGQSAEIAPSTTLRFDRVVSDSRCPAKVQCIWAGEVKIALTLGSPDGQTAFELSGTTNKQAGVKTFSIMLESFGACASGNPGECATLRIAPIELR
jgi:hypothetical protein